MALSASKVCINNSAKIDFQQGEFLPEYQPCLSIDNPRSLRNVLPKCLNTCLCKNLADNPVLCKCCRQFLYVKNKSHLHCKFSCFKWIFPRKTEMSVEAINQPCLKQSPWKILNSYKLLMTSNLIKHCSLSLSFLVNEYKPLNNRNKLVHKK